MKEKENDNLPSFKALIRIAERRGGNYSSIAQSGRYNTSPDFSGLVWRRGREEIFKVNEQSQKFSCLYVSVLCELCDMSTIVNAVLTSPKLGVLLGANNFIRH